MPRYVVPVVLGSCTTFLLVCTIVVPLIIYKSSVGADFGTDGQLIEVQTGDSIGIHGSVNHSEGMRLYRLDHRSKVNTYEIWLNSSTPIDYILYISKGEQPPTPDKFDRQLTESFTSTYLTYCRHGVQSQIAELIHYAEHLFWNYDRE